MAVWVHMPHDGMFGSAGTKLNKGMTFSLNIKYASPFPPDQLNEADTIKVAVRVRPLFGAEKEKGAVQVLQVADDNSYVKVRGRKWRGGAHGARGHPDTVKKR